MRIFSAVILAAIVPVVSIADVIRPTCQTEESRGLRYASEAMYRAAEESEPFRGHSGSLPTAQVDMMNAVVQRFKTEARMNLLKARAIEAAKCPEWAPAIMANGPVTKAEKESAAADFDVAMEKNWASYRRTIEWQKENPQCERVYWMKSFGGFNSITGPTPPSGSSIADFSGNFKGKKGYCSADADEDFPHRGVKDDLTMNNPDTNPLIAKVACGSALQKLGLGEGWYADPKLCGSPPAPN